MISLITRFRGGSGGRGTRSRKRESAAGRRYASTLARTSFAIVRNQRVTTAAPSLSPPPLDDMAGHGHKVRSTRTADAFQLDDGGGARVQRFARPRSNSPPLCHHRIDDGFIYSVVSPTR